MNRFIFLNRLVSRDSIQEKVFESLNRFSLLNRSKSFSLIPSLQSFLLNRIDSFYKKGLWRVLEPNRPKSFSLIPSHHESRFNQEESLDRLSCLIESMMPLLSFRGVSLFMNRFESSPLVILMMPLSHWDLDSFPNRSLFDPSSSSLSSKGVQSNRFDRVSLLRRIRIDSSYDSSESTHDASVSVSIGLALCIIKKACFFIISMSQSFLSLYLCLIHESHQYESMSPIIYSVSNPFSWVTCGVRLGSNRCLVTRCLFKDV